MELSGTHVRYLLTIYQMAKIQTEFSSMEVAKALTKPVACVSRLVESELGCDTAMAHRAACAAA